MLNAVETKSWCLIIAILWIKYILYIYIFIYFYKNKIEICNIKKIELFDFSEKEIYN